jgi:hypothetical protein
MKWQQTQLVSIQVTKKTTLRLLVAMVATIKLRLPVTLYFKSAAIV